MIKTVLRGLAMKSTEPMHKDRTVLPFLSKGVFILAVCLAPMIAQPAFGASKDTYKQLDLFGDVLGRIGADYVDEVDEAELIENAINGMLSSLDPHSAYLSPDKWKDMRIQTKGEFGGLGIEVTMENGLVKVVTPIDETPAARAGILAGDLVTHLDGEAIMGLTLNEAVEKMRGPINSQITLTIAREGETEPLDIVIVRDIIKIRSVRSRVEGEIGYVRITSFNEQTQPGLEKSLASIKDELGENFRGVVLDLRNNPGGLLNQAISVSDTFLNHGEIVSTRGRNPDDTTRYNATGGDLIDGKPMVVLINGGSASASEIVAGALQDHRRAIVMGTQSFGKGSVQTLIPLNSNQGGALKLTTQRYYTPSGRSIQAKGISPDLKVEQSKVESLETNKRFMRTEADLRGHLNAESEEGAKQNEDDAEQNDEKAEDETIKDYQLVRAIDFIYGISLLNSSN